MGLCCPRERPLGERHLVFVTGGYDSRRERPNTSQMFTEKLMRFCLPTPDDLWRPYPMPLMALQSSPLLSKLSAAPVRQTSDYFFFALLENSLYGSGLAAFVFLVAAVAVKCEFSAFMRQT